MRSTVDERMDEQPACFARYYKITPRDNQLMEMRYQRGFIPLQDMIDHAIINLHTENASHPLLKANVLLQQMPAPCHRDDRFLGYVYPYVIPVIVSLAWLFSVAHSIKSISHYKEFGLEEVSVVLLCQFPLQH